MKRYMGACNIIVYWFFQIVVAIFVALIIYGIGGSAGISEGAIRKSLQTVPFVGFIVTGALMMIVVTNFNILVEKFRYGFINMKKTLAYGIGGFFVMFYLTVIVNMVLQLFKLKEAVPGNEKAVQEMIKSAPLFLSFLVIAIITPLLEEIVFRTSFMAVFTRDEPTKKWYPYLLCAVLFAIIHDHTIITNFGSESIANFITYLIPALTLSLIYRFSNHNLAAVYLVHLLNNGVPLLAIALLGNL